MTTTPLVIALTGRPDVGKDTVASFLAPLLGFQRIAFADALRREVSEAWRIDQRMLTDRATKEWAIPALAIGMCSETGFMRWCLECGESLNEPRSPRWALQNWASYQRRTEPDRYARIVRQWIDRQIGSGCKHIVVSDLRDPVEAKALRPLGLKVVRIHRPDARALPPDTAGHISEQHHRIPADHDIVNDGALQALAEATVQCLVDMGVKVESEARS